jgi:hypothetical protein
MVNSGVPTSGGPVVGKARVDPRDWVDKEVAELLRETFAMIPQVAGDDQRMKLWLKAREPMMLSYTKKLWLHMQAATKLDYCVKSERLYSSMVTAMPVSVLLCKSKSELDALLVNSIPSFLGVSFTEDELEGKSALAMLGNSIQNLVAPHIASLRDIK